MNSVQFSALIAVILASISDLVVGGGGVRIFIDIPKDNATAWPNPSIASLENTTAALLSTSAAVLSSEAPNSTVSEEASSPTTMKLLETSSRAPLVSSSELPLSPSAPIVETTAASSPAPVSIESTANPLNIETTSMAAPTTKGIATPAASEAPKSPKPSKPIPSLPPVDFDCRKKSDGYYPDPKDKCSGTFYACIGGLARRLDCGEGDLVYEPDSGSCERRHESFRCTGTRRTTVPTTPRRPPPPPVKLVIDCSKLDDGWYSDPHKKCSHIFYSCSNGIGSRFECPGRMYFDIESKSCQAFQDVVACAGKKPPTTKKIETSTIPRVTEKLPIDCADKPSGQFADPTKKCSQIYYVCSNGDGLKRSCPDGLYYDDQKQLCDYYEEVFACAGRTKPASKPTPAPSPSVASLLSKEFKCANKADGSYLPVGKKCSDIYFRCVGGAAYKLKCPDGLFYDVANDLCDRWINLFECSGKKPTSPLPVTTVQPKPTEKLPVDCGNLTDGDYPDPENKCSSTFYSCSNNLGSRRHCADNAIFDRELRLCDLRENVPDCTGKPRPLTTVPSSARPRVTPKLPYNCEKRTDGNYAAGKCIDYYWSCVGGSTIRAACPRGTFYDSEMDECGYKNEIPACGGVRPSTEKP